LGWWWKPAWHYLSLPHQPRRDLFALRDLSSKLVVEERLNWRSTVQHLPDALLRISISSLFATSKSWSA
jgi:hypothetical protein